MGTTKQIEMNQFNGTDYDVLQPSTTAPIVSVSPTTQSSLGLTQPNVDVALQKLSTTTKSLQSNIDTVQNNIPTETSQLTNDSNYFAGNAFNKVRVTSGGVTTDLNATADKQFIISSSSPIGITTNTATNTLGFAFNSPYVSIFGDGFTYGSDVWSRGKWTSRIWRDGTTELWTIKSVTVDLNKKFTINVTEPGGTQSTRYFSQSDTTTIDIPSGYFEKTPFFNISCSSLSASLAGNSYLSTIGLGSNISTPGFRIIGWNTAAVAEFYIYIYAIGK